MDALIAATALQQKAVLVHADNHFRSIPHDCLITLDIRAATQAAAIPATVLEKASRYRVCTKKAERGRKN